MYIHVLYGVRVAITLLSMDFLSYNKIIVCYADDTCTTSERCSLPLSARAGSLMALCANIVCQLSILLQPYMPQTSSEIQTQLNVSVCLDMALFPG